MDLTSWLKRVVFYRMDITFSQAFAYWNEIARDYTIKNREAVWTSQFSTCRGAPPQKRYGPLPANHIRLENPIPRYLPEMCQASEMLRIIRNIPNAKSGNKSNTMSSTGIIVLAKTLEHSNTNMTRYYAKFSETVIHRPVALHAQRQGVVTLAERIGSVERRRDHGVDARARDARHARADAPRRAVVERQRERRGVQHRAAVECDGVGQRVVCGDGRLKAALRRGERVGFPGLRGECARDGGCKQQERFSHHFFSFSELHIFSLIFRIRASSTFTALRS